MEPRTGGMHSGARPDDNVQQELNKVRDGDPFYKKSIANYELLPGTW